MVGQTVAERVGAQYASDPLYIILDNGIRTTELFHAVHLYNKKLVNYHITI